MNTSTAQQIAVEWLKIDAQQSARLAYRIQGIVPEPEAWTLYRDPDDDLEKLLTLKARSLFLLTLDRDNALHLSRARVFEDGTTSVELTDQPFGNGPEWSRSWRITFQNAQSGFPVFKSTSTLYAGQEPPRTELLARTLAELAGFEIGEPSLPPSG